MHIDAPTLADPLGAQALAVNFVAVVTAPSAPRCFLLQVGQFELAARLAYSCLVLPQPGDRVACWRSADGSDDTVHILAVLERADTTAPLHLALGPQATVSADTLQLRTTELAVHTERASLISRAVDSVAELWRATVGQLKLAGGSLTSAFEQEAHHNQQHRRVVDGIDHLQARVVQHRAEVLMHLEAEDMLANGDRLVKVRGSQIHFG